MMRYPIQKNVTMVAVALALSGCMTDAHYGQIERSGSGLFLEKLTVTRNGSYQKDNFSHCVTLHAKSSKIMLSDNRYNFYGPLTGKYYTFDRQYQTTDGKSHARIHEDGRRVSTYGNARWRYAAYDRYMSYHLHAENAGDSRYYIFDNVTAGGIHTGDIKNSGAVWPLAARGPEGKAGLQTLVDIVDKIEQCQRNND